MKTLYSAAFMLAGALAVHQAQAACDYPVAPGKFPDGNVASRDEIKAAKDQVVKYDADMNAYLVCIRSEYDAITGVAEADGELRPGVVSMSHNFGGNPGEDEDPRIDGANTNRLLRVDVEYDRYTGQPRMGALPVAVVAVASAAVR